MMQPLPLCGLQWHVTPEIFDIPTILSLHDEEEVGYILEVDLDYPSNLHVEHNDYPFCAEKMKVPGSKGNAKKLLLTLNNMKTFYQYKWLKPYIDLNTNMRKASSNEFEKNFYNLMANAVFGKTMENVRDRIDIHLVKNWGKRFGAESYISQPNFKRCVIFNENFALLKWRGQV